MLLRLRTNFKNDQSILMIFARIQRESCAHQSATIIENPGVDILILLVRIQSLQL